LATFNPVNKTVTFTLKANETGANKKLGVVSGQAYNFTMTYDEAAGISSQRIQNTLSANTLANRTLGITSSLVTNPTKTVTSPSYMEEYGYKYELHPTLNQLGQRGVNISIQKKDHSLGTWKISSSGFFPINPNDKVGLNDLENKLVTDFNNYVNVVNMYNSSILNSKDTLPIDYNN
jgi:hypothetical protein